MKLPRACAYPGCMRLTRERYCAEHLAAGEALERERKRAYSRRRGSRQTRGYDATYDRARKLVLAQSPHCARCGAPATEVHHVVPLSRGGTNDVTNLVPLCRACHHVVHVRSATGDSTRG